MMNDSNKGLFSTCYTCKLCFAWWRREKKGTRREMILTWKSLCWVLCSYCIISPTILNFIIIPNFQKRKLRFLNSDELIQGYSSGKWQSNSTNSYLHNSAAHVLYITSAFQRETRLLLSYKTAKISVWEQFFKIVLLR